ncbi:MAG: 3-isopropylmalate dehydratase [Anaerolineaceae bacterium 4572_32.2]|nr:MAG: 3-isopropylmalate dehydratase [Anaerolineaceae bacterium 4572_32.2]
MRPTKITGRLWALTDPEGKLYDDIDTDMIFHNRYLHITDVDEMGQYALDNLEGWKDFSQKAQPGDIVMAGKNFGAGSSRQQAVDCFRALGIGVIVAESFGAIYKRNAINSGMPIVSLPGLTGMADEFETGAELEVDLTTGQVTLGDKTFQAQPFSQVQMDIYQAGNLFAYGKSLEE